MEIQVPLRELINVVTLAQALIFAGVLLGNRFRQSQANRILIVSFVIIGTVKIDQLFQLLGGVEAFPIIDAATDQHLWSETYDRTLTAESLFQIQDDIAKAIVEQLGVIMEADVVTPGHVADTKNIDAYELYLEGLRPVTTYRRAGDLSIATTLHWHARLPQRLSN